MCEGRKANRRQRGKAKALERKKQLLSLLRASIKSTTKEKKTKENYLNKTMNDELVCEQKTSDRTTNKHVDDEGTEEFGGG